MVSREDEGNCGCAKAINLLISWCKSESDSFGRRFLYRSSIRCLSVRLVPPKRLVSISTNFGSVSVDSGFESHKTWPAFLIRLFLSQDNCSVWFQRLWVAQLQNEPQMSRTSLHHRISSAG